MDPSSFNELVDLGRDPTKFNVVGAQIRPGTSLYAVRLEYEHFPPRTPKNDLLEIRLAIFEELLFFVISVPVQYGELCCQVAEEMGLRLAEGVPCMMGGGEDKFFPTSGPTTFTLEHKAGHPIYNANPQQVREMVEVNQREIQCIINADMDKAEQEGFDMSEFR